MARRKDATPKGPKAERVLIFQPEEHPDTEYPNVPGEDRFMDMGDADFVRAKDLESIGALLIDHYEEFAHLKMAAIGYAWKRKGGAPSMSRTLGKCVKASGLTKFYSDCDYVIWLAADHLRELRTDMDGEKLPATCWQVEALIYHELKHAVLDDNGRPAIKGHEWEGFASEITEYGNWSENAETMRVAWKQLPLPMVSDNWSVEL